MVRIVNDCGDLLMEVNASSLVRADLAGARLPGANFANEDLTAANLEGADLTGAYCCNTNLGGANLVGANLSRAMMVKSDLSRTNLENANLEEAEIREVNFELAYLKGTVLDPYAPIPGLPDSFEDDPEMPGWVIGYRSRRTTAAGISLIDDRIYGCEVFSVCQKTECHPGWYLCPTVVAAQGYGLKIVKVRTRRKDGLQAGNKCRTRTIWVIGDV